MNSLPNTNNWQNNWWIVVPVFVLTFVVFVGMAIGIRLLLRGIFH